MPEGKTPRHPTTLSTELARRFKQIILISHIADLENDVENVITPENGHITKSQQLKWRSENEPSFTFPQTDTICRIFLRLRQLR